MALADVFRKTVKIGGGVLSAPAMVMRGGVKTLMYGGVALGVYEGSQFVLSEDGKKWIDENIEDPTGFLQSLADETADGGTYAAVLAAQIGPEASFGKLASMVEMFGKFLNWIGFKEAGLNLMNSARAQQEGKPPLVRDPNGNLVEATIAPAPENPTADPAAAIDPNTKIDVTTNFGTQTIDTGFGTVEADKTFADAFVDAAKGLDITLDENLSLDDALKIANAADPKAAEEFRAIMDDDLAAGLFQKTFDAAKADGWGPTNFEGNISGFFNDVHDGLAANVNAPITLAPTAGFSKFDMAS